MSFLIIWLSFCLIAILHKHFKGYFNFVAAGRWSLSIYCLYLGGYMYLRFEDCVSFLPTYLGDSASIVNYLIFGCVVSGILLQLKFTQRIIALLLIGTWLLALPIMISSIWDVNDSAFTSHPLFMTIYCSVLSLFLLFWTYTFGYKNRIRS